MAGTPRKAEIPGYSNGYVVARKGEVVRLTDLEGYQVGDLFAVSTRDHDEYLSNAHTRLYNGNLFPRIGEQFYTTRDRPILTFLKDTSPGFHDMLYASCNPALFARRGKKNHPNCRDNYYDAAGRAGIAHTTQPDPVNIFQNPPPRPAGSFILGVTMSRPGDYVELRAEMDCVVIVTACSSERILGGKSTPMRLEVKKAAKKKKKT